MRARPQLYPSAALIAQVDTFDAADWALPTDCVGWTPREMVAHLAGSAESAVRLGTFIRCYGASAVRAARWNSWKETSQGSSE